MSLHCCAFQVKSNKYCNCITLMYSWFSENWIEGQVKLNFFPRLTCAGCQFCVLNVNAPYQWEIPVMKSVPSSSCLIAVNTFISWLDCQWVFCRFGCFLRLDSHFWIIAIWIKEGNLVSALFSILYVCLSIGSVSVQHRTHSSCEWVKCFDLIPLKTFFWSII